MDIADGKAFPIGAAFTNMIHTDIKSKMQSLVFKVQDDFCKQIQKLEECSTFSINKWNRPEVGEGITRFLEDGDVFEKVGVCASKVSSILPSSAYLLLKIRDDSEDVPKKITYFTTGISGVVYPKNPHIPILNFSYRYFEMNDGKETIWWFSGGSDLSPCILNREDCHHFHKVLKQCCDKYTGFYYKAFKKKCDEHFYLKHRGEGRGVGGIFFNQLSYPSQDICFQFVQTCMENIIQSYMPIVVRNMEKKYSSQDKDWQLTQRGRYAEFYLISDKTTNIVLMTPGVECDNVLMFLPPSAKWHYNSIPDKDSKEFKLVHILRTPEEWA